MHQAQKRGVQALLAMVAFSSMAVAGAIELPPRQSGLWKQTHYEGKQTQEPDTVVYQCVDEATDAKFRAMSRQMAGSCTQDEMTRQGNTLAGRNVCQLMGSKVTTEYVVSGNMKTEFRIDSRSKNEPPLFGAAESESVVLAEWQGPCKPGQKPGDMIYEEDGETGTVSMEDLGNMQGMAKALEQLQSQSGGAGIDMQDINKMMEQLQQLQK